MQVIVMKESGINGMRLDVHCLIFRLTASKTLRWYAEQE